MTEIRRTIQILSRKTKSNPVLLGSPGVGKTAILEGLAQRIVNKEVPEVGLRSHALLVWKLAEPDLFCPVTAKQATAYYRPGISLGWIWDPGSL
jgi:Cdc6-like AAA superfamily ATPase